MYFKELTGVQFGHLTNPQVETQSVKEIKHPETYENSEPKIGGLLDPSLGTTTIGVNCSYCNSNSNICEGHWGHINLGMYQFHSGFINHVVDILSCICLDTCKLLIPKEEIPKNILSKKKKFRLKEIKKICLNVKNSPYTGYPIPKIYSEINKNKKNVCVVCIICEYKISSSKDEKSTVFLKSIDNEDSSYQIGEKVVKKIMTPEDCYNILQCINEEECKLAGFSSNPEDFILKCYPIPPVSIRPSLKKDQFSIGYGENNLTQKLSDIVKWNNKYKLEYSKYLNSNELAKNVPDYNNLVQYHIYTYFDNDNKDFPRSDLKSGGQPSKSLTSRYKGGKSGRIRANLMAKRVNYSARTVITSDPMINTNELGVPLKIAMKITYPEIVTSENKNEIERIVKNGKHVYPGVNFIEKVVNGEKLMFDSRYKDSNNIEIGNIVHRHLCNGDIILFNRQPSLHKMNMMSHTVKIIEDPNLLTFRMNVTATNPYGADFDGDEMNLFAPQSIQSKCELMYLSNLYNNIISPKNSSTVVSLKQDSLIGIYLLSTYTKKLDWYKVCSLISTTTLVKTYMKDDALIAKKSYNGNEIISLFLPNTVNLKDGNLVIESGCIKSGYITKDNTGSKKNNLIHYIYTIYGNVFFIRFLDDMQRLSNNWLMLYRGFTIGIMDFLVANDINDELEKERYNKVLEIENLLTNVEDKKFLNRECYEQIAYRELDVIKTNQASYVKDRLDDSNNMYLMSIKTKSKGDLKNIGFTMTCMGQTAFKGKLIPYSTNRRTLSYFSKNDDTPFSRGFIFNNYSSGLKCAEFIYHNLDGRQGIIDTAIKTGDTGYLQRKIIKGAEDVYLSYDKSVRNSMDEVVQFVYGSCGYDVTSLINTKSKVVTMTNSEVENVFVDKKLVKTVMSLRDEVRNIYIDSSMNRNMIKTSFNLPLNIIHFTNILNSKKKYSGKNKYSIKEIEEKIEELVNPLHTEISFLEEKYEYKINIMKKYYLYYKCIFYEYFNPYRISKERMKSDVDNVFHDISIQMLKNLVHPGDMIGIISAQSIGEPLTQFTLDTFHSTGSSTSITAMDGIKSFIEIINISKNLKVPLMYIYLTKEFSEDIKYAELLSKKIVYLDFQTVIKNVEFIYDTGLERIKNDNILHGKSDVIFTSVEKDVIGEKNKWTYRVSLNKEEMLKHNVSITDIKMAIYFAFKKSNFKISRKKDKDIFALLRYCVILSNTIYDDNFIIHIRLSLSREPDLNTLKDLWNNVIKSIHIKGNENIEKTSVEERDFYDFDAKTGEVIKKKEYIVISKGINLDDIFNIYGVDSSRTYCNNINLTNRYYGIESARKLLVNQINTVFEGGGITMNHQHFTILADIMTRNGVLTAINRYGLNKLDTDPLSKASFEKTMNELIEASIYEDVDVLRSVSSRIMTGKVIRGGSGLFDVLIDVDALQRVKLDEEKLLDPKDVLDKKNEKLFEFNPLLDM